MMEPKGVVGASQPQWISVKDRLPEKGVIVLVFCKDGDFALDYRELFNGWSAFIDGEITHWMPLGSRRCTSANRCYQCGFDRSVHKAREDLRKEKGADPLPGWTAAVGIVWEEAGRKLRHCSPSERW